MRWCLDVLTYIRTCEQPRGIFLRPVFDPDRSFLGAVLLVAVVEIAQRQDHRCGNIHQMCNNPLKISSHQGIAHGLIDGQIASGKLFDYLIASLDKFTTTRRSALFLISIKKRVFGQSESLQRLFMDVAEVLVEERCVNRLVQKLRDFIEVLAVIAEPLGIFDNAH